MVSIDIFVEWQGLEGILGVIQFQLAVSEVARHCIRQPTNPSSLALDASRDGASTACLGSLCQCLTTVPVTNFFLTSNLSLPLSV